MIIKIEATGGNMIRAGAHGAITNGVIIGAKEAADLIKDEIVNFPFEYKGESKEREPGEKSFSESIDVQISGGISNIEIIASSSAKHAIFLEEGAAPHVIYPTKNILMFDAATLTNPRPPVNNRKAGALIGSGFIATKYVNHPGIETPPMPFATTMRKVEPLLGEIFRRNISNQLVGGAGRIEFGGRLGGVAHEAFGNLQTAFRGAGGRFVRNPFVRRR